MKHFVGDYKPTSLLNDLEISATRAFIEVFGDVKVTICLAGDERDANEDDMLSNLCRMISGLHPRQLHWEDWRSKGSHPRPTLESI